MYKICKTPRAEARQMEFQDTLIKMLKKQKMKDITIVSLCKEMGISRKTFYQYFDTLEDVLYVILDKELRSGYFPYLKRAWNICYHYRWCHFPQYISLF